MLTVLKIRHLALVDSLTWELGDGLVCVTGETGAGKSVIVGAVKLVLGERADRAIVRTGEESCTVEAMFQLPDPASVDRHLDEAGLDPCEGGQLVIRRTIAAEGGNNRQFVNGSPCTLAVLKAVGQHLVDLHGPHDHQSLLSRERQLTMLDAYANASRERDAYSAAYRRWKSALQDLEELRNSERASNQETDLLKFQIAEIEEAALEPDEEESIESRYRVASNSQKLVATTQAALATLTGITEAVAELQRHLSTLNKTDAHTADLTAGADTAALELSELEANLTGYMEGLEIDPETAARLEARLDTLHTLKRKYGNSVADVIAHGEAAARKLAAIENRSGELDRLEAEAAAAAEATRAAGKKLGVSRKKAAPRLATAIAAHLAELGFQRSQFEIALVPHADGPGPAGLEGADFLFAPNPGEPLKPLRQTASSGEMSRTMLAVKSALVNEDNIPLLIFDEIDANVGGEIAAAVGRKMAELARNHQVVSITHLPQVAALASSHYRVTKAFDDERTRSTLAEVRDNERVRELARMLGGDTASARAHAVTLLAAKG